MSKQLYTSYTKSKQIGSNRPPQPEPLTCGALLVIMGAVIWALRDKTALELLSWLLKQLDKALS